MANNNISNSIALPALNIRKYFHRHYFGELWAIITNITKPIASFFSMFIILKFVSPKELGIFQTVFLVVPYFAFIPIGVFNGLRRNIAFYNGQKDSEKAERQAATSMFIAHVTALIGTIVAIGVLIYNLILNESDLTIFCSIGLLINLLMFGYNTHYTALFSGYKKFKELGNVNLANNIATVVGALFPIFMGVYGLVVKSIITNISVLIVRVCMGKRGMFKKAAFNLAEYRDLVLCGFPIMLSGYINSLLVVADRSVVAAFLGTENLGYYALSAYFLTAIVIIPQSISLVLYPKASEAYGRTGQAGYLRRYMLISIFVNVLAILPIAIFGYLFIEDIITLFFPIYSNGVKCAKIACVSAVFLSYSGVNIVFMVLKKNIQYQITMVFALAFIWLFGYLSIKYGYGVEGVAIVRMFAMLIVAIFTISFAWYFTRNKKNDTNDKKEV